MKLIKVLLLIGDYSSKKAMIYYRIVHEHTEVYQVLYKVLDQVLD